MAELALPDEEHSWRMACAYHALSVVRPLWRQLPLADADKVAGELLTDYIPVHGRPATIGEMIPFTRKWARRRFRT
jgi:hypothetical protein